MEKKEIITQTKLAFDFIEKLYLETSYFIKEIEGILQQEEEEFQILRPAGYAISTYRTVGLETDLVRQWFVRKGVVFFAAKDDTEISRGQTITKVHPDLKLIVVRFLLYHKDIHAPEVWAGLIYDIAQKKKYKKFEHHLWEFVYNEKKIFKDIGESSYEGGECAFKLNLFKRALYDITNADDIQRAIIEPLMNMYRAK